jgi:type I restriction enzyme M protein
LWFRRQEGINNKKPTTGMPKNKNDNENKVADEIQSYISLGEKNKLLSIKDGRITYTKIGKSYNFRDPEETVRASFYVKLIEKYKYPENRIDLEVEVPRRKPSDFADIVIYEDDARKQPYIVAECKKEGISQSEINQAIEQVFGNANSLRAKFAIMVAGSVEIAFDVAGFDPQEREKNIISDIPIRYGKVVKFKFKKGDPEWDLKPANLYELQSRLQQCHDIIWQGGKRNPAEAFDEMSKLIFCKDKDERILTLISDYYSFQVGTHETAKEVADRVRGIYQRAQQRDPDVFEAPIRLSDEVIYSVVEKLQGISLSRTELDSKGRAFEIFLKKIFRGEMGQYFTPREIVRFMVNFIKPTVDDVVIDPACGSGGFLLYILDKVRRETESKLEPDNAKRLWRDFALYNLYGIEVNSQLSRIAMMNMIIHEDGHSNIENNDALDTVSKFNPRRDIKLGKYTLLLTNPPFGATVSEKEHRYLADYLLGSKEHKRKQQRTEVLFIERCLDFLKEDGRMGIVLPDGILGNPSTSYVRKFILENSQITGVISLPSHTFTPSGVPTINTSLLFLQKKKGGAQRPYKIFMAVANNIGYEPNGKPTIKEGEQTDLDIILSHWERFLDGETINEELSFVIDSNSLEDRFDARYYWFKRELKRRKFTRVKLSNFVDEVKEKIDPRKEPSKYYPILSVINEGVVIFNEERLGEDINQKYKVVRAGDIAYNPYRINVGSIGVVPKELDGMLVSPAYVVMRIKDGKKNEIDPHYIVSILRNSFYRLYLELLATGSIRDAVPFNVIKEVEIPSPKEYQKLQKEVITHIEALASHKEAFTAELKELDKAIENVITPKI